ncbi:MAG TPA: serine/threonine-protein kinase, partial [Gemmataceae bacterium]|nr:serine/threonine-protein kinase [Gemmataceae bacterium]
MTGCPDETTLGRLIGGGVPDAEAGRLEAHLGACRGCRDRMDALAGAATLSGMFPTGSRERPTSVAELRRVIDQLCVEPAADPAVSSVVTPVPPLPPSSREGFVGQIGAIEIRRVIGRGGMGVVYEGWDPALDRPVAVKVLSPHLLGDEDARARFLREARAVAALAHEHVVAVHAIDHLDGMPYLVLAYVPGGTLADRLAREPRLPFGEVVRIGAQVAKGLAAAHARGLVHRDVKPANILLDAQTGLARVADFGLAKLITGEPITTLGIVPGTPAFMSPEQAGGRPVDHRSDLYSLGVILYLAAAGEHPTGGESPAVILDRIRTADPDPLGDRVPGLPGWFCALVHRLLAKDPVDRVQTAAELAALLEGGPTGALPARPGDRAPVRPASRRLL